MSEKTNMDRRSFLKGAALVGGTAAIMGVAGCQSAPSEASDAIEWDEEYDVVVLGSGTAIMAALTAARNEAKVLVVEKGSAIGGTSILAGAFWLPCNPLEKEKGIEDKREDAVAYAKACADAWGGKYDDAVIESYFDNGLAMYDMLSNEFGCTFTLDLYAKPDYFNIDGQLGEGRSVGFSQDGKHIKHAVVWPMLQQKCEELGVEFRTGAPATELVTDGSGAVVGVKIESKSSIKAIKANKGVVVGTGGFDFSEDMKSAFLPAPFSYSMAVQTNTGDGQRMGASIGASLANMGSIWGCPSTLLDEASESYEVDWGSYRGKPGTIVVNRYGERFGNESSAYPIFNRSFEVWDTGRNDYRNIPAFFICDSSYAQRYPFPGSNYEVGKIPEGALVADTVEDLCDQAGIDRVGFAATLSAFNSNAVEGVDPTWCRGTSVYDLSAVSGDMKRDDIVNSCLAPISEPPFYAMRLMPGSIGTNGGLEIDGNGQVLDQGGSPISGLYAVGNASGSVFGGAYPGAGATIGSGFIMGFAAANHMTQSGVE